LNNFDLVLINFWTLSEFRGEFGKHLNLTQVAQQSVTKII
jgi:hypothetical protein